MWHKSNRYRLLTHRQKWHSLNRNAWHYETEITGTNRTEVTTPSVNSSTKSMRITNQIMFTLATFVIKPQIFIKFYFACHFLTCYQLVFIFSFIRSNFFSPSSFFINSEFSSTIFLKVRNSV